MDLTAHSEVKDFFQQHSLRFSLHLKDKSKILSEKAKLVLLPLLAYVPINKDYRLSTGKK